MRHIVAAAALLWMATPDAGAVALCNCCDGPSSGTCEAACAPLSPPEGQCQPAVDYAGKTVIGPGENPLYDMSLNNLALGAPSDSQLELLRRLLEKARLGAENDREAALVAHSKGEIDDAEAAARVRRYDDAIVNYYLGQQVYRAEARRRNRQ
jgi:hypothetical protein